MFSTEATSETARHFYSIHGLAYAGQRLADTAMTFK